MAKLNFFGMFKRKTHNSKDNVADVKQQKETSIEEMSFDELYGVYTDCKIKEIMADNPNAPYTEQQKLELEEKLNLVVLRMIDLIKQKDPQALAFADKLVNRYVANYETLKKLNQTKNELLKFHDRITELEIKELIDEKKLTSDEVRELKALKEQEKIIDDKLEEVDMQISSLKFENDDKYSMIVTFEIESPELAKIEKEKQAEEQLEIQKILDEIESKDGSSNGSSNNNADGGIQPGE